MNSIAVQMRKSFPSFGGVMLWDASQAYRKSLFLSLSNVTSSFVIANGRYDLAVKNSLIAAGGTGFSYPSCTAPAYIAGTGYSGGSKVSYGG